MTADDFTIHMPPHVRPEFVAWLAKRDRKAGIRAFRSGYEQGYWEGRDECWPEWKRNNKKETL